MGMCGGGEGYSTSAQASQPWDVQAQYLSPLFASNFASLFGRNPNTGGTITPEDQTKYNNMFAGKDAQGNDLAGTIKYYGGDKWKSGPLNNAKGMNTSVQETIAPNVAGFSPEELAAQNIIKQRTLGKTEANVNLGPGGQLANVSTGYTPLIPNAKTAMNNIVTGNTKINPASMNASSVNAPSNISAERVSFPGSMNTPQVGDTDLGYKYWDELGNMAGGSSQNPYLEQNISNATRNMTRDFYDYQLPSLDTTAEMAGKYGGNTWGKLRNDAYDTYLRNLGEQESTMRGNAYDTNQANALSAMNTGGNLATTESGYDANRALQQASMDLSRQSQEYGTKADIGKFNADLGLQGQTSQAGNELQRFIQNAMMGQEAGRTNAGFQQDANVGNVSNIMQGAGMAAPIQQSDYEDISRLAASGESQSGKWQDVLDAFVNQFQTQEMEPYQRASLMSNLLSGDFGGTTMASGQTAGGGGGCF